MDASDKSFRRRWLLIGIFVFALAAPVIWFATMKTTTPAAPSRVVLSADTNGTARLLGVSLANTNVRDGVFKAMVAAGMKAAIAVPAGLSPTNQTQVSNFIQTLEAMGRTGLFPSNSTPITNDEPAKTETPVTAVITVRFQTRPGQARCH